MTNKDNGGPASDRELLEMAAKAAGITSVGYGRNGIATGRNGPCLVGYWNPLTDDGDALRLAVKLNLRVFPQERCCYVESCPESLLGMSGVTEMEMNCSDPLPATRRAIVRAAAAIGSAM